VESPAAGSSAAACGKRGGLALVELAVVESCRTAHGADVAGAVCVLVAAPDTLMGRPTVELLREGLAGIPLRRPLGRYESLQDSADALRLLGTRSSNSRRPHHTNDASAG